MYYESQIFYLIDIYTHILNFTIVSKYVVHFLKFYNKQKNHLIELQQTGEPLVWMPGCLLQSSEKKDILWKNHNIYLHVIKNILNYFVLYNLVVTFQKKTTIK
jgi:hypothetical protein